MKNQPGLPIRYNVSEQAASKMVDVILFCNLHRCKCETAA